jgi:hypothetical protein
MADTLFTVEFREACAARGCPFCSIARARTRQYLSRLLYEFVTAPDIHSKLAESRGFCNAHAWLIQHLAQSQEKDGLGIAILYGSVVQRLMLDLEEWPGTIRESAAKQSPTPSAHAKPSLQPTRLAEALGPSRSCLACENQAESERYTIAEFVNELQERGPQSDLARAYDQSDGACLPHVRMLMAACSSEAGSRWLASRFHAHLAELAAHLELYMRKHQVEHSDEPMGAERDSWVRVIEQCAGKRGVPLPDTYGGRR